MSGCAVVAEVPAEIDERVVTLNGDVVATDTTVSVPLASNYLNPGDIAISESGILRHVDATHEVGDRLVLDTSPATLEDAVIDGEVAGSLALSSDDPKADTFGLGRVSVAVDDVGLFDNQYLYAKINHAKLVATPTIDLNLAMHDRQLQHFDAILHGDLDASIDVEVAAHKGTVRPAIPIWTSPPQLFVQWVGWIPVVEAVTLSVGVRFDSTATGDASVHLKGHAHLAMSGGVTYDHDRGFDAVTSFSKQLDGAVTGALHLENLTVRAYLYSQVDVKFYGLAGPYINAGPYIESTNRVGLYSEVGGSITAFGAKLPAMPRFVLADVSTPL